MTDEHPSTTISDLDTDALETIICAGASASVAGSAGAVCSWWHVAAEAVLRSDCFKAVLRANLKESLRTCIANRMPLEMPSRADAIPIKLDAHIARGIIDNEMAARLLMQACLERDITVSTMQEQEKEWLTQEEREEEFTLMRQRVLRCKLAFVQIFASARNLAEEDFEAHRLRVQVACIYQLQAYCAWPLPGWPGLFRQLCNVLVGAGVVPSSAFRKWSQNRLDATTDRGKIQALIEVQGWLVDEADVLAALEEAAAAEKEEVEVEAEEATMEATVEMSEAQQDAIHDPRLYSADQIAALGLEWAREGGSAAAAGWVLTLRETVEVAEAEQARVLHLAQIPFAGGSGSDDASSGSV